MDLQLQGSKALITGGTKGIGRAIANTLADEGCNVSICARNEEEVDAAVNGLTALLEPLIMVFLAVVVGGFLIAMYLPIFTIAGNIQ